MDNTNAFQVTQELVNLALAFSYQAYYFPKGSLTIN